MPSTAMTTNHTTMIGPNRRPTRCGAVPLDREHRDQDDDRDRHDVRIEQRRRDLQALDGAEDGDRRRDHAVAVQQRGAEDAHAGRAHGQPHRFPLRAGGSSAVSARMPPSPWLSARMTIAMYLTEMTRSSE